MIDKVIYGKALTESTRALVQISMFGDNEPLWGGGIERRTAADMRTKSWTTPIVRSGITSSTVCLAGTKTYGMLVRGCKTQTPKIPIAKRAKRIRLGKKSR